MGVFEMIFGIVFVGIVADAVTKVAGGRKNTKAFAKLEGDVEALRQQLQDQAQQLADTDADLDAYAAQIEEMQQRLDFAERLLAQHRNRQINAGPPM